jgi:protocatechuate 3,4-dioxygenase beta subunit
VNSPSFHRHRMAAALSLVGALALSACAEAPPSAPQPPTGTEAVSLVPVTSQQIAATLGDGLAIVLETRVLGANGQAVRSATVEYDLVSGAGLFSSDSTLTNDQGTPRSRFRSRRVRSWFRRARAATRSRSRSRSRAIRTRRPRS